MSVKVLVADDHEVVRRGLASLFNGSDIKIVAEAKNGDEAVTLRFVAQYFSVASILGPPDCGRATSHFGSRRVNGAAVALILCNLRTTGAARRFDCYNGHDRATVRRFAKRYAR